MDQMYNLPQVTSMLALSKYQRKQFEKAIEARPKQFKFQDYYDYGEVLIGVFEKLWDYYRKVGLNDLDWEDICKNDTLVKAKLDEVLNEKKAAK